MKVHSTNVAAIYALLAETERDTLDKTTAQDLFALIRELHNHLPVRLSGLRGTTIQTSLTPAAFNAKKRSSADEVTWIRLIHDGKTWVLEDVQRSPKEKKFVPLSIPAKHEIAAQHVHSSTGLKVV